MLNAWSVQNISHGWLASWLVYLAGNPWTRLRTRNCMCAFFCRAGGGSVHGSAGKCLSKTASVSACDWDVGVGKESVGAGRSFMVVGGKEPWALKRLAQNNSGPAHKTKTKLRF